MSDPAQRRQRAAWAYGAAPAAFLLLFFLLPGLLLLGISFRYPGEFGGVAPLALPEGATGDHGLTLESYRFFVSDPIFLEILARSFGMALLTTLLCLVIAYPLALLMARQGQRRRELLVLLVVLPFASNFLVRIYAWILILGPLDLLYSTSAVLIGLVYVHLPFMVLPLYTNLEQHEPLLLEAARDLGAGPWQRFRHVTLPLSLPGIASGSALVFIPALGMFAVPELLGGTGDVLIGNLIKEQFLESRDWPFGATLAIVLMVATLLAARLSARFAARRRGAA